MQAPFVRIRLSRSWVLSDCGFTSEGQDGVACGDRREEEEKPKTSPGVQALNYIV